jgi:hypothetical protein
MTGKEAKAALIKYKQLYRSLAKANKNAEQTINDLQLKVQNLTANLENAQKAVDINKNLLHQVTHEHNNKEQALIGLLTKLKAKLREMGYDGNFDRLG